MNPEVGKKLEEFFKKFKKQVFRKGEILVRIDEDPDGIFYLTSGVVKEYAISKNGDELVINVFKPVAFFPMSWAINGTSNEYYFEAVEECEIHKAPREEVVRFIKENPDVLYDLMSRVYRGMDGILKRMVFLMSGEAYSRVVNELVLFAKRFGVVEGKTIKIEFSEKYLASQMGMARETVSREIKILKDKGLVTFDKNILTIFDIEKLQQEIESF